MRERRKALTSEKVTWQPLKASEWEKRAVKRKVIKNHHSTVRDVAKSMNTSKYYVGRELKILDMNKSGKKKPMITNVNKKRLNWAKEYSSKDDFWSLIIWSDENKFMFGEWKMNPGNG